MERGIIVSRRRIITVGDSKAVTLPKTWIKIHEWFGEELTELVFIGKEIAVLVPPGKEDVAKEVLVMIENRGRR